jgi:putative SOS response-associated peptidase YedK
VLSHVRTLCHHLDAGSDQGAVWLWRATEFSADYNVAPTQPIPVVRLADGKRSFALMRWGLLPSWVKDLKTFPLLINARGESLLDKPAFRNAMRRRRCLIPADGFYEWKAGAAGAPKQPYFVRGKRGSGGTAPPLAFAGLWETWTGPNGEEVDTAAIVTTTANRTLAHIHGRMPVFVPKEAFDLWLDCATVEADAATALIRPADDALLEAYAISTAVNRIANDSEALITPGFAAAATPPQALADVPVQGNLPVKKEKPKKAKKPNDQASLF